MDSLELHQQKKQPVLTATQQLNQQRQNRTFQLQNEEELREQYEKQKEQILSHRAELYQLGHVPDMNLTVRIAPSEPAPPVSQLSERNRKKIEKKRTNNLKKAQKKHIPGATADTLPMMNEVKAFYKETAKKPIEADGSFHFDARLFSPDFPEEKECSIDVKKGMITLEKLRRFRQKLEQKPKKMDFFKTIAIRSNNRLIAPLENALRIVLAANGVDMDTGNALTDPEQVEAAKAVRAQAVAEYEKAMANVKNATLEETENYFAEELRKEQAQIEKNNQEHRNEVTADLDFAFHYLPSEEEFLKLRESIDKHPKQYAQYKEVIDSAYQIYLDSQRQQSEYGKRLLALQNQAKKYPQKSAERDFLEKCAAKLVTGRELDHLQLISSQQYELIRHLTENRPFPQELQYMYKVLEDEYGIRSKERDQQKQEIEKFLRLNQGEQEVYRSLSPKQQQDTLYASEKIYGLYRQRENVLQAHETQLEKCGKDRRALKLLLGGASTNATGAPLNVEEGRRMMEDDLKIKAYLSNDPAVSGPLLAPVVEEILSYPYLEINVEEELKESPAEFHTLLMRNVYMQNMISDHPEYFQTVPEETMKRLNAVMNLGVVLSAYVSALAASQGLEFNTGRMYEELEPVQLFQEQLNTYAANYEAAKAVYRQKTGG